MMERFYSSKLGRLLFAGVMVFLFLAATRAGRAQTNMSEILLNRVTPSWPAYLTYTPAAGTNAGAYWFAEYDGGAYGRIDTVSNVLTEVIITNGNSGPYGMTLGPDGYLWITEPYDDKIAHLNPTNSSYAEFQLPYNVTRDPAAIITGPDGRLWFVEQYLNRLAAVSTNLSALTNNLGLITNFFETPAFDTNANVIGLTVGADSNLWFTEANYGAIGRYNLISNTYTLFPLPVISCTPCCIVGGPDGALWFTEYNANKIGRITTDGRNLTEFTIPLLSGYNSPNPNGIANGPDGNLWFTEYNGGAIGRITPGGIITLFRTLAANSYPLFLTTGGDSNIWYSEFTSDNGSVATPDRIGRLIVAEALGLSTPSSVYVPPTTLGSNLIATFQNSTQLNTVVVNWGDGTSSSLAFTNAWSATNVLVQTNPVVTIGAVRQTNVLAILQTVPLNTNNYSNGSFNVYASHTFPAFSNYFGNLTVTDASNDMAFANLSFQVSPLGITAAGTNVLLYWPTNVTATSLQQNFNLLTTNWTTLTNPVVLTNGRKQVLVPVSGTNEFFRLH